MTERFYLIDGSAFAYRSFFAIRAELRDSQGRPTNAAYGFARVLLKTLREEDPHHIAVVFDAPGRTFRSHIYEPYKATRRATPLELVTQLPMMDEIVKAFNIPLLRIPDVEADDVMATLARRIVDAGMEAIIVTSDKDLLQLVRDGVRVYDPAKGDDGLWYTAAEVKERFGVEPKHVVDVLGLMGDTADNVPGVKGIGEKTARKLLETYGTIEGVYQHLDELKGKVRENLEEHREMAFLSRQLVTVDAHVNVEFDLESARRQEPDRERLIELFSELEFQSLLEKFLPDASTIETLEYELVLTEAKLAEVLGDIRKQGQFSFSITATSSTPMLGQVCGMALSCHAQRAWYVPIDHDGEACYLETDPDDLFGREAVEPISRERALELVKGLLEDPTIGKVCHNAKDAMILLARSGINLRGLTFDTMVASYLTDASKVRHNLVEVSLQYLKRKMIPMAELLGKGSKAITFDKVPVGRACGYACEEADITWRLAEVFRRHLRERGLERLFTEVELPLINVLVRMEMAGIAIDVAVFERLQLELTAKLKSLEASIYQSAQREFQINSPKQLQTILFDELGLAPKRKTKTGYSTDVDVLEELAHEHPLPEMILEYRMLEKLRGTYVEALPKLVHPDTGRLHTSFNQAVAATGRLSSSEPNLQNIPIRNEIGRRIRAGFIPGGTNCRLISADYSQIELRILAHLSGDDRLREAFVTDADIHRETAARVFGVAPDAVTPEMRRQSKVVNFGIIYGISAFGLSRTLGVSASEAALFIDNYLKQYPGVREWIEKTVSEARDNGYVTTLLNRRRYVSDLGSSNSVVRKAAERIAVNTPVQGGAADIIKLAMVRLDEALHAMQTPDECGPRLLLQVHDELLVEAHEEVAEAVAATVKDVMENAVKLNVPLKVDVGIGASWAEIH